MAAGKLFANADAGDGEITVKVTGYDRKTIDGIDMGANIPLKGNKVRHEVKWNKGDIGKLKGHSIRLEVFIKGSADIYRFQAIV